MSKFEPASGAITADKPARHGVPWEQGEFEQLINEVQQGLTLPELADRHQRTHASITGAALRLIPPALRPTNHSCSVDVLAQYLRENKDTEKPLLAAGFRSIRPTAIRSKSVELSQELAMRSTVARHRVDLTSTVSTQLNHAQTEATNLDPAVTAEPPAEYAESHHDDVNVGMLVIAAIASLPKNRDCSVLGMRLGIDGQPLTFTRIGAEWRVSAERARQIQERALGKLARRASSEGTPGSVLKKLLEPFRDDDKALATWLLETIHSSFEIPPRIAAKLVLRTAGCTKERTDGVVDFLPAVVPSRKARLSNAPRDRGAAESVGSDITHWLEHTDWPDVIGPPPPAAQLSAHRITNASDIAGSFYSHKRGCTVNYESGLELDVLTALELSERIAYYQEQPTQIPYTFMGRKRQYFPDVFAATTDGRGLLIEVKPTDNMALSINRAKADAGRAWAHAHGWGWLIVSDRLTFREIEEHIVPATGWAILENELKTRGTLTWRDILNLRTRHGLTRLDFTAYIVQSGANVDRSHRVTPGRLQAN